MKLIEIISHKNKIKTVDDLLNNFDAIVELARDDIYRIAKSKQLSFNDFDFTYWDAVEILRNQLKKSHLKGVIRFLKCGNISNAVSWLIERLLNNMRNISSNQKYKLYCAPSFGQFHENIKSVNDHETVLELMDLEKFDRDSLKKGLQSICKNLVYQEDFDYSDMEYLCDKYGFEMETVVNHTMNLQKYRKEQVESGHSQLVFVFESEVE